MSVTILEALRNAEHNLKHNDFIGRVLVERQLHNAIGLLEKGYLPLTKVEPLLEKYGDVEAVPDCEEK